MNLHKIPQWRADLHIHSFFSDGKFSPVSILEKAKKMEINAISITDHDSVYGVSVAIENCKKYGVEVIPGIEFSCDFNQKEVHILGYFIDIDNKILNEYIQNFKKTRIVRIKKMIEKLNKLGCELDVNGFIDSIPGNVSIGRPHLAEAMVKKGFVKNYMEAFVLYIGDGKPAYEKKENPDINEIIKLISKINGISFVAHPGKNISINTLKEIVKFGINGIEIYHPSHSPDDTKIFLDFSNENNLLVCGGSDFHGVIKADYKNLGKYFVDKQELDRMKSKVKRV